METHAMRRFVSYTLFALLCTLTVGPAAARVEKFPSAFKTERIKTGDATLYVRVGGSGPAVVLLHCFGATGDMSAPVEWTR
jgi:hypothetical protein